MTSRLSDIPFPDQPRDEAFYGLLGRIARTIEPHSEADPAAILAQTLVAFGNIIGRDPHFCVEADIHHMNLFVVLVGTSGVGRKGASLNQVKRVVTAADPTWNGRVQSGITSGEGIAWAIRDQIVKKEAIKSRAGRISGYQNVIVDPGIGDKRLLAVESEYAAVLKVCSRPGNIVSPILRQAWDGVDLQTMTKNNPVYVTDPHVGFIGHITAEELRANLQQTEMVNGFANRFLWVCAKRSKFLPDGGSLTDAELARLQKEFRGAVEAARRVGEIHRDPAATELWHEVYPSLSGSRPGLYGAVTRRAEAQVMRLSCLFALSDGLDLILEQHLRAALALWDYVARSAHYIFGDALGDPTADKIRRELLDSPHGLNRTAIIKLFANNTNKHEIDRALALLEDSGLAHAEKRGTAGRPSELWFTDESDSDERNEIDEERD